MFKFPTKRNWIDNTGGTGDSSRSFASGLSGLSPNVHNPIALKLKEKLQKAREFIALKKSESMATDQTRLEKSLQKDKSEESEEEPDFPNQRDEGFTEKYNEQNELQRKARQTMVMLKKNIKKREPAIRNPQINPQNIPILNYHYQQGPGMALPSGNLRHMAIFDLGQQSSQVVNEEKFNMKIDDPNSVLHIANYHQNKDFEQYAKVIVEDNKQFLKINAPDAFTFFRLHHELHEINRKKSNFIDMKGRFFDNKDPEEIIQYDENLDNFDAINSDKNYSSSGKKRETTDKKEYQYAEKVAKMLKETGKKKDVKAWEKNLVYGLMGGIKDSKAKLEK